ncbi:hypothetical protein PHLCEN_2v190 [Hermanssonia centrifuga]|uniref:Uncharacterized protein n=1 Tax=Hermanssonia centrifuga TaxID=98765 RepID=A0A2R6S6T8_9APHY|nr:hypothetical protein PHLCEN_2v190 [Hermanssonia centrifuga]
MKKFTCASTPRFGSKGIPAESRWEPHIRTNSLYAPRSAIVVDSRLVMILTVSVLPSREQVVCEGGERRAASEPLIMHWISRDASLSEGGGAKFTMDRRLLVNASIWLHVTVAQTLAGPPTASNPIPTL